MLIHLYNFHWIHAFWWLLSHEASHTSKLYIQTRTFQTSYLQQMYKGFIYQHILLKYKSEEIHIAENLFSHVI